MSLPRKSWILLGVSIFLTIFFALWTMLVTTDATLPTIDMEIAISFKGLAEGHHAQRAVMIGFTHSGGVPAMIILAIVGALWQWSRGDALLAIGWIAIVASGGLVNYTLKKAINRDRPAVEWRDLAVVETNESFPSGHSMGSMIGYGMVGFAVLPLLRRRFAKIAVIVALAALVGTIGFSRIYLRAHWFSDVIGGFTIGAAWLTFGLSWVVFLRQSETQSAMPPSESV